MRLPQFEYVEPNSIREASKVLATDPKGTVLLAGGTDLLVNMKHRVVLPKKVINLKSIPRLSYISESKEGLKVGALTSLYNIATSTVVKEKYPSLAEAAREVGAYSHQVMGTIGGNLCQQNRCRFYNQSPFWRSAREICYKAGGKICHVVKKSKECHSAYCGDMAPVLIALDAKIKVIGPEGERSFPLKRLYTGNGKKPLALRRGEILREILIPQPSGKTLYLKWRLRGSLEFPIVSLAMHIDNVEESEIRGSRIVFSAVGPAPVEAIQAEKMLKGVTLDDRLIEKVAIQAVKEISPMRTSIYSPSYKRKMAGILVRQALSSFSHFRTS